MDMLSNSIYLNLQSANIRQRKKCIPPLSYSFRKDTCKQGIALSTNANMSHLDTLEHIAQWQRQESTPQHKLSTPFKKYMTDNLPNNSNKHCQSN
jgi:hypothetical protein